MMETVALRLQPGSDLRQSLLNYCITQRIEAALILGCVGSLRNAEIRFAENSQGTRLEKAFEILSLSGTLSLHGGHFHITVADSQGQVIGGHLLNGSHVHTTAEVVLGIIPGMVFNWMHDPMTGYSELDIVSKR